MMHVWDLSKQFYQCPFLELRLSFWMLQNAGEVLKVLQAQQLIHIGALVGGLQGKASERFWPFYI